MLSANVYAHLDACPEPLAAALSHKKLVRRPAPLMSTVSPTAPATSQTSASPRRTALSGPSFSSRCVSHVLSRPSPPPPLKNARMAAPNALKTPNALQRVVIRSIFVGTLPGLPKSRPRNRSHGQSPRGCVGIFDWLLRL